MRKYAATIASNVYEAIKEITPKERYLVIARDRTQNVLGITHS